MIDTIKIYGERNTGTNYLQKMIERNTDLNVAGVYEYGWKHGPPIDTDHARDFLKNVFFIFMIKNPYSWLLSLKRNTHQVSWKKRRAKKEISLDMFVREPFEHGYRPIELYTEKIRQYRVFQKLLPLRTLICQYEILLKDPLPILQTIAEVSGNERPESYTGVGNTLSGGVESDQAFPRRAYYLDELWKNELTPGVIKEVNRQTIMGTLPEYRTL